VSPFTYQYSLNRKITCPSCWHDFSPDRIRWIASHPDLLGDMKVGEHESLRFLPSKFNVAGNAIDEKGNPCERVACPQCHLSLPRPSLDLQPLFYSIVGTPACGKSYLLASMCWQLRQTLPAKFKVSFTDADPQCNQILNDYEEQQFLNPDHDTPVQLRKTEEQGDNYAASQINGTQVQLPRPFLFATRPIIGHPNEQNGDRVARLLCLYDNAGESYIPGRDSATNPVTRHLAKAAAIFFCFDPTQDARMKRQLQQHQSAAGDAPATSIVSGATARQEIVLHEMISRFRSLRGLGSSEKTECPLIVIVTKLDVWRGLTPDLDFCSPIHTRADGLSALNMNHVAKVSSQVREFVYKVTPELITSAEAFSRNVYYIPVSATGCGPVTDPVTGITGVRPRDIQPIWCDIPLVVMLSKHGQGLIPHIGSPRKGVV
jgi:hypothetical protein